MRVLWVCNIMLPVIAEAGSGVPDTRRCGSTVETPRAGTPDEPLRDG